MMTPVELAENLYRMLKAQRDEVYVGDDKFLSSVKVDGRVDLIKIAAEIIGKRQIEVTERPDMPIAEAREWLQEILSNLQSSLKYGTGRPNDNERIAALDAALHAIDLLSEG
jgi:hypothetical protein